MIWISGLINVASDIYSVRKTNFYITKSLAKNATKTITIISNQELSTFHITFVPINKTKISWVPSTWIFKLILTSVLQKKFAFCQSKEILIRDPGIAMSLQNINFLKGGPEEFVCQWPSSFGIISSVKLNPYPRV